MRLRCFARVSGRDAVAVPGRQAQMRYAREENMMGKVIAIAVAVLLLVTGCFGEGIRIGPPKSTGEKSSASGAPGAKSAPSGKTLRLMGADPPTMDPALAQDW